MRRTSLLAIVAGLACVAGAAQAQTYTATPALPIPAGAPAITTGEMTPSTLEVSGGPASIGLMRLTLNLTHTFVGDLDIFLVPPSGDRYLKLTSDNGGTGANFTGTVFVDSAAASITTINALGGYTGEWRPEGGALLPFTPNIFGDDDWGGASIVPPTAVANFAAFAGSNANGTWTLFLFDDAGGDVGTLDSWSIQFSTTSPLAGFGAASIAGVCPAGGSTLITVQAIPAVGPPSTGITGRVDLSSVGGSSTQALFDNGTNGDVTAGDNLFSYRHTMPATQPTGLQNVTWTLSDAQARTATGSATFNVNCLAFQDNCEDATTIFGPGTHDFDTVGFTIDGPAACTGNGSANGWLKYRATRTGETRIHTCGLATFDTVLAVYDACGGAVIGCDDDTCDPGLQSEVFVQVTEGTEYWIRISGFGGAVGAGQVGIEEGGSRLTVTGLVSPDPVPACEPMLITATVIPGSDPVSTGLAVTADTSDFGGGTADTMFDDGTNGDTTAGDNVWSLQVNAPNEVGFWFVDVNANDNEGRVATDTYFFESAASGCVLTITSAVADPDPVVELAQVLLTVTVAPASTPTSTGLTVTGDLVELGGSTAQQFFDDGTNGDVTANDNTFSFLATAGAPDAFVFVDVTAADAEGRQALDTILFAVTGTPSGACCLGSSCQILRQAQCEAQGGNFAGANTNCGGAGYEVSDSTSAFVAIADTGSATGIVGDDVGATVALPFAITRSGTDYTEAYVNSNGLIVFGGVSNALGNVPFPTPAVPNNMVAALWDDLFPTAGNGAIYTQEFGTAPNRTFVVSWENIPQYAVGGGSAGDSNSFQVVFTEGSQNILFRYGLITAGIDANAGAEDASGSIGVNVDVGGLGGGDTARLLTATIIPSACDGNTGCGSIDFNGDGLFPTDEDIIDLLNVFAGGQCSTGTCGSIDFNGDGLFPADEDILAFLRVFAGGNC